MKPTHDQIARDILARFGASMSPASFEHICEMVTQALDAAAGERVVVSDEEVNLMAYDCGYHLNPFESFRLGFRAACEMNAVMGVKS